MITHKKKDFDYDHDYDTLNYLELLQRISAIFLNVHQIAYTYGSGQYIFPAMESHSTGALDAGLCKYLQASGVPVISLLLSMTIITITITPFKLCVIMITITPKRCNQL